MERIVLRHLSGSKANQVEEFPLSHFKELVAGRDPSATVKYDPDRDDLVGRQHAKIAQDPADPTQFTLTDLNSRNGTYLNKQRIVGTARLAPGDVVQFGAGGPEFQFDLEPRPNNSLRPTRTAVDGSIPAPGGAPATRVPGSGAPFSGIPVTAAPHGQVGKATVERMIAQTKSDSRKWMVPDEPRVLATRLVAVLKSDEGVRSGDPLTSVLEALGRDLWIDFVADTGDDVSVSRAVARFPRSSAY